jgi:hypothetical protein
MLVECKSTTGVAISTTLLTSLHSLGFTNDLLKKRLLGFCTDGASNLHGCVKGAIQLVAERLGRNDLLIFHCMNHKLELAVHDAVSTVNRISHLKMFMDTLYAYYSRSSRNSRLLANTSKELEMEMRKIGKIFDVRWLSSSYRSIYAVYNALPALAQQLTTASEDCSAGTKDRAKAFGMAKKLNLTSLSLKSRWLETC